MMSFRQSAAVHEAAHWLFGHRGGMRGLSYLSLTPRGNSGGRVTWYSSRTYPADLIATYCIVGTTAQAKHEDRTIHLAPGPGSDREHLDRILGGYPAAWRQLVLAACKERAADFVRLEWENIVTLAAELDRRGLMFGRDAERIVSSTEAK